jgi:predicted transcriptional regulator
MQQESLPIAVMLNSAQADAWQSQGLSEEVSDKPLFKPYDAMYCMRKPMGAVSLRLPEDLESRLSEEARLSGQGRSQLIREALEALLLHRREERAQAVLRKAAQALVADPGAGAEALDIAEAFLTAENEALTGADAAESGAEGGPWWR